jgi:hypothetical protein
MDVGLKEVDDADGINELGTKHNCINDHVDATTVAMFQSHTRWAMTDSVSL